MWIRSNTVNHSNVLAAVYPDSLGSICNINNAFLNVATSENIMGLCNCIKQLLPTFLNPKLTKIR